METVEIMGLKFVEVDQREAFRVINGVKTPVSNPDRSEGNNLG